MDYEKKYKEALEIAKRCYKDLNNLDGVVATMSKDFFEEVFPELKESEDERIRKGLIKHLDILRGWTPGDPSPIKIKEYYDVWISWLEKQGKQKLEEIRQIVMDEIRAKMAIEIYIHGLVNPDGTYTQVSADNAVMHADYIIKSLNK